MSVTPISINNLRTFLKTVTPTQARISESGYTNQVALVNSVAVTSLSMNINPKTEPIQKQTSTGTITVSQPVINPIPINNSNSFIQTNNNQISVTSEGETDTIINANLINIINIEDVTNSGYTRNNSVSNLYDSISSNYWNPQVNIGNVNPYFYKLNYTFTGTSKIFKFVIKNDNDFPGFTNIRLYPTTNPSNYVDIQPFTDTNNQYVNQTVALLIDDNGEPLFDTNDMTAEFELNPSVQPDTYYQYGQAYGTIYNNDTLGLRAGNYVNTNTGAGDKLLWTTNYLENLTTTTGTNNTDNNYLVSTDGVNRIVQNKTFYQYSTNTGVTYTKNIFPITNNMVSNSTGQYVLCYKYISPPGQSIIYASNNYGNTFNETFVNNITPSPVFYKLSSSGNTQCIIHNTAFNQWIFYHISINYGVTFNSSLIVYPFGTGIGYNNLFVKNNTNITLIITLNSQLYIYTHTGIYSNSWTETLSYSSRSPDVILLTESISYIEQNYNSNESIEGQYKTALGTITGNELAVIYTKNTDYTYTSITDHSLFTEWYTVPGITLRGSCIKLSNDGSKQVIIVMYSTTTISLYSTDSGDTWQRSAYFPTYLNICTNIVSNNDFSLIQASGGYYYSYQGQYRTDPVSYLSTDGGFTWILNSAINPASSIVNTNFFEIKLQTNKTYFQVKDLNQNQVLGISDNGFNMSKDLRVNNHDMYVLGGTLTVGPDETSSLLNNYELNIDGTLSARNIVLLSDERFKNVIGGVDSKTSKENIEKINIVKYKFNDRPDDNRIYTGIIAQNLANIMKDIVDINKSIYKTPNGDIDVDNLYSINYTSLLGYLISAIQYNQKRIKNLEKLLDSV
jgi:hypothetical protein